MNYKENQLSFGGITTSRTELKDLLKAWIAISAAFAIALSGRSFSGFYSKFVIASLTVGIGFLLHEMGHKALAQRYGCFAEFRSFDSMLVLAVLMSFFGFIFAAPGAVMISGKVSKSKSGRISAAGPAANLALAAVFLLIAFSPASALIKPAAYYGFVINSWLALFNMIPFRIFDGYKIFKWSKPAYFILLSFSALFMLLQELIKLKA